MPDSRLRCQAYVQVNSRNLQKLLKQIMRNKFAHSNVRDFLVHKAMTWLRRFNHVARGLVEWEGVSSHLPY